MCHHGQGPGATTNLQNATVIPPTNLMVGSAPGQLPFVNGPPLPSIPPLCNPCSSNSFNSVPLPAISRWGPRTSCPVHSPFRVRVPNGSICSGHQVNRISLFYLR